MFDNIGGKIKTLAKVGCWIGIIAFIITGIVLMAIDEDLILDGILTAVVGSLLSWVSSFVLYGFGQLVENSDTLVQQNRTHHANKGENFGNTSNIKQVTVSPGTVQSAREKSTSNIKQVTVSPTESQHKWRCDSCGEMISSSPCPYCGK